MVCGRTRRQRPREAYSAHTAIMTVARRFVGAPCMLRTAPLQQTTTIGGSAIFSSHTRSAGSAYLSSQGWRQNRVRYVSVAWSTTMQSFRNAAIVCAILTGISTSPLYGQGESRTARSTRPDCPPGGAPPNSGGTTGRPPLSDRLSDSKGVICPPRGVDPGIVEKPPATNAPMPVIPPPGTPPGDPGTQPK
jgi:hypothetical protein